MKNQKIFATLALLATLLAPPSHAQIFTFGGGAIPDGNATGISFTETITSAETSISTIKVTLNITGDFNGDLYLELRHGSAFSVLLNRPGVTAGNSFGFSDNGYNITLDDDAAGDVHFATSGSGQVTGEWQPDARDGDPASAPRTSFLDAFENLDPNGQWTLFAADLQNTGTSQIQSWGMELTAIPEPHHYAFAAGLGLIGLATWHRLRGGEARTQPERKII
jgi:subtilisin-like proprotein convertase family protein